MSAATMEPEVQTASDDTKTVGCRECGRPCVVSRFMAPGKVACSEHKSRRAEVTVMRDFDDSLEKHVLTDKAKTKDVPCRECGRRCVVTTFASADKVRCNSCRVDSSSRTRRVATPGDGSNAGGKVVDASFFKESATLQDIRGALTLRKIRIARPGPSGKLYEYEYGVFRVIDYNPVARVAQYRDTYTMGLRSVCVDDIVWIGRPKSAGWPKDVTYAGKYGDPAILEAEARA